jgi:hypothetical protein
LETKAIAQQSAGEKAQATELHWERFSSDFNQDKTQNGIWGGYEAFSYQLCYMINVLPAPCCCTAFLKQETWSNGHGGRVTSQLGY